MKAKIQSIEADIDAIIQSKCDEKYWIHSYGAFDIDPKYLVFWICVQSDHKKNELIQARGLMTKLRSVLEKNDYPLSARDSVFIGFESQETVDRESNGNWYQHFK